MTGPGSPGFYKQIIATYGFETCQEDSKQEVLYARVLALKIARVRVCVCVFVCDMTTRPRMCVCACVPF